jgi:gas vesicle protein
VKFLLGLGIGVVLGVLCAPASGEETRQQLVNRARDLSELPQRKAAEMAEDAKQKAGDLGARIGRQAAEAAVETATGKVSGKDKTA